MVAFLVSLVLTIGLTGAAMAYGRRRPVGAPLSWGQAMVASTFVFFVIFMLYGVVPHQWLGYADNTLGWRRDKFVLGPGNVIQDYAPFAVTYEAVRDMIAAGIYIVGLGVQIALWAIWQNRGKQKPKEIETSAFGRPLVRST